MLYLPPHFIRGGYRVISAGIERMASEDTSDREEDTSHNTVIEHRFAGVLAA